MKVSKILIFAFLISVFFSCNSDNKDKNNVKEEIQKEEAAKNTINSMQEFTISDTLNVNGKTYNYEIKREVCDSLGVTTTMNGRKYKNNTISLKITRKADNSVFFSKTFKKTSFSQIVPDDFMEKTVLLGIQFNYDRLDDHSAFFFAASVGDPEDDELLIPMYMNIDTSGNMTLEKANLIDVDSQGSVTNVDPDPNGGV